MAPIETITVDITRIILGTENAPATAKAIIPTVINKTKLATEIAVMVAVVITVAPIIGLMAVLTKTTVIASTPRLATILIIAIMMAAAPALINVP
ncbi:MAG TPA: hypothetical protein V6C63_10560 [Allocoleopsis sp.]